MQRARGEGLKSRGQRALDRWRFELAGDAGTLRAMGHDGLANMDDPLVPLLDLPLDYEIVQLSWRSFDVEEPFIDLTVSRARARRTLRFLGPRVLQLGPRFEQSPRGLEVRDISARGIGALKLRVEGAAGALSFWAKSVLEQPGDEPGRARSRRLAAASELEQVLERFDPRLAGDLTWTRDASRRSAPARVEAHAQAPRGGAAARYFIISTR